MQHIKFSKNYSKLENKKFTTIRRYDRYKVGIIYNIQCPGESFEAELIKKEHKQLNEISTDFLLKDTDKSTRSEAIKLLNQFYKKRILDDEKLTICYFERVKAYKKDYLNKYKTKCPETL